MRSIRTIVLGPVHLYRCRYTSKCERIKFRVKREQTPNLPTRIQSVHCHSRITANSQLWETTDTQKWCYYEFCLHAYLRRSSSRCLRRTWARILVYDDRLQCSHTRYRITFGCVRTSCGVCYNQKFITHRAPHHRTAQLSPTFFIAHALCVCVALCAPRPFDDWWLCVCVCVYLLDFGSGQVDKSSADNPAGNRTHLIAHAYRVPVGF